MDRFTVFLCRTMACITILLAAGVFQVQAAPIIIDHTSLDRFYTLTDQNINDIQAGAIWHYAHTSHGSQLTTGLSRLESSDNRLDVTIGYRYLPSNSDTLNIFDGQENDNYITPEEYWRNADGRADTQSVLDNNPLINISQWSWCTQTNSYTESQMQDYLDQMAAFELANPDVTFVYMTGTAQYSGSSGNQRYQNNEMIREWVRNSENRVLFDFADLDAWWFNGTDWEQETYVYNGELIPVEHDAFALPSEQAGHTTYESCEQKGRAVWVMMAEITDAAHTPVPGSGFLLFSALILVCSARRNKTA